MRPSHSSNGTPSGSLDVWWRHFRWRGPMGDIEQLPVALPRTPPFQWNPLRGHVTYDDVTSGENASIVWIMHNFRLRMRAPHPHKGTRFGVTWRLMTSHPSVAMLLPIMRNGTFCTTTIVSKKRGNRLRMRTFPVMWLPVPVASLPIAPPQIQLWLCWYTTYAFAQKIGKPTNLNVFGSKQNSHNRYCYLSHSINRFAI